VGLQQLTTKLREQRALADADDLSAKYAEAVLATPELLLHAEWPALPLDPRTGLLDPDCEL